MKEYCYDKNKGVFYDYNYVKDSQTGICCAACYLPFIAGISDDRRALDFINNKLLYNHGVVSCEELQPKGEVYQWGFPNAWAPHNYYAYEANKRVGNCDTALEICEKFLTNISDVFEREGKLYEKYDAVQGGKAVVNEYGTPEMLGWTAGVFQYLYREFCHSLNFH